MADLKFNKPILMYPKKQGHKYILSKHFYDSLGIALMCKGREVKDIKELTKANLNHLQLYGFKYDDDFYVMIASDKQMLKFLAKNDIFNSLNCPKLKFGDSRTHQTYPNLLKSTILTNVKIH